MNTLTAALIYTRVSTDEQATNGLSLPTQLKEARRYAASMPDWVIGDEYQDVLSGKRSDRPGYQRLLAEAKRLRAEGRSVAVVVAALDRLGRDIHERVRVWRELDPLGVTFHSVREGGVVSEFVFNVLASVAREEVRRLAERVTAVRRDVRTNGWKAPGRSALGYRWRERTPDEQRAGAPASVLEVDPETAPVVVEAFRRAAAGESVRSVARWIASLPDEVRGRHEMAFRAVQKMLAAPVYVGRPDQGDPDVLARPPGRWAPLVSDDDWAAVQARIAGHRKMPRQASGRYLLSGLLFCPRCGERLCGSASPGGRVLADGRRATYPKYRCERRARGAVPGYEGPTTCETSISAAAIDAAVVAQVGPVVALADAEPAVRAALRRAWRNLQAGAAPDPGLRARIGQLERTDAKARERLKQAALLLVDGGLDRQGYQAVKTQAERDLEAAEQELARLRRARPAPPVLPDLDAALSLLGGWSAIWHGGIVVEQRRVLEALVDRVVPIRVGYGKYEAGLTWTPLGDALRELAAVNE
jgi:site-specific DNA recombinase